MHWHKIESEQALNDVIKASDLTPVLFFKHSNRCSISAAVLNRLERAWAIDPEKLLPVMINVIDQRNLSNKLSQELGIWHESPQALVVKDGKCIYHSSHMGISYRDIAAQALS